MNQSKIIMLVVAVALTTACSKEEAQQGAENMKEKVEAMAPAAEKAMDTAAATMDKASQKVEGAMQSAGNMIDHTTDEIEFKLKRSISGLESLRDDIKDSEQVAAIEKEIADLKSKLESL